MVCRLLLLLMLSLGYVATAQQMRYFQFTTTCGHGNWQDSAFVAATNDSALIALVNAELAKPMEERKFIAGPLAAGNGGHNHNAGHWFKWHFAPNEWNMVEVAIEVCDGCPYSDIDADTTYWLHTIGEFCPWSGQPVKEISDPTAIGEEPQLEVSIFPNPTGETLYIRLGKGMPAALKIFNAVGAMVVSNDAFSSGVVDVANLPAGLYWLEIEQGGNKTVQKVMIAR